MSKLREGYKQTKVGVIPEEWEVVRLGDIVDIKSGYAFKSKNFIEFASKYQVIKMSNIYQNKLLLNRTPSFLNNVTSKELEFLLNKGDIVITLTGTMGKRDYGYSVQINNEKNLLLNQRLARLREINNKCNISFIGYQLKNDRFLFQFFESTRGGTGNQANVGIKDLSLFKIPLPPLKEQQKIAQIFSTWDSAISKQEALIKAKEQLKKGLMQKLLSGEVRFEGFNGEWEFTRLGDLLDYLQPTPYLVANKEYDDSYTTPVLTAGKTFILGYTKEENGIFKDDLPVIIFDDFTTATKFVDFPFKAKSSAMKILKAKDETVNVKLVFEMMQMINYEADDHKRYWISEFQEIEIKIPSPREQQKIAQILTTADKEIALLKEELETLKEQKRGLMQRLLSGDMRVKV